MRCRLLLLPFSLLFLSPGSVSSQVVPAQRVLLSACATRPILLERLSQFHASDAESSFDLQQRILLTVEGNGSSTKAEAYPILKVMGLRNAIGEATSPASNNNDFKQGPAH